MKKNSKKSSQKQSIQVPNTFQIEGDVYTMDNLNGFIKAVGEVPYTRSFKYINKETIGYIDIPCSFDIETTSAYTNGHKTGFMYIWMFGYNGICIYGRTWEEFLKMIDSFKKALGCRWDKRVVCYVHNLAFEFQFIRKLFNDWVDVFCLKQRCPIYATLQSGIEFRCSYMLTGCGLAKVGEELTKYKCKKLVGDLDYNLIRHSGTPLTETEMGYCINDIRVVMCKIKECIEKEGGVAKIPLTLTGYVRRDVKRAVFGDKKAKGLIQNLKLTTEEYQMLKRAFQGGFTHANALKSGIPQKDVVSYDFTSSYPSVLIAEQYPMSIGELVEPKSYAEFAEYLRLNCCLMDIVMTNVKLKDDSGDAPISFSKCVTKGQVVKDNGRIRYADELLTTITEQDFFVYKKFYTFEYQIGTMYVYKKGYLPKPIIECVLDYYIGKTTLKDVEDKAEEYLLKKGCLNSIYGMMVMDIVRAIILYNEHNWIEETEDADTVIERYNEARNRFTWYPWGIWVTAYARRNLFTGIYECGKEDYIYSDTDSIKILNAKNHEDYIFEYNRQITEKLEACLDHYDIDKSKLAPLTIKGVAKPLGVWDFDGHYSDFKTLGAKRYMVRYSDDERNDKKSVGTLKTTIAGVSKKEGAKYFSKFDDPFDAFKIGVKIEADQTGKKTHTYIDYDMEFDIIDYRGNVGHVVCPSGIHLEGASFELGISNDYEMLLRMLEMGDIDER